jgi:hypothetical protein
MIPVNPRAFRISYAAFIAAALYAIVFLAGLDSRLNFFPSDQWMIISMVLSLAAGAACVQGLREHKSGKKEQNRAIDKALKFLAALLFGAEFYIVLAYGLGPAFTAQSYVVVERDIAGTKVYEAEGRRRAAHYYIDTPDLPERFPSKFYICRSVFNAIPKKVHMHVTLHQSFFGMAVVQYNSLNKDKGAKK